MRSRTKRTPRRPKLEKARRKRQERRRPARDALGRAIDRYLREMELQEGGPCA